MADLIVKNADWIVTVDENRRILRDSALAVEGDKIVAIGKTNEIVGGHTATKVIDAAGKMVMPGLVDTHVHNTQQLGRGLADGCDIPVHLLDRLYGYESNLLADDAYWAALACQLELIRAGTTCFIDPGSFFPHETARAVGESGLRGVVARTAFDVHETMIGALPETMFRETTDVALSKALETVRQLNGAHEGRVKAWFALRILVGCSDRLIREIKRMADENGVGVVLHASESRDETVASRMRHGRPDVERIGALGALGPNMCLIHMGWASPKEIVLCMKHDLKVSCTPSAGYRLGMGSMEFGRFPEMLELGVTVALGSDAAMSSNYLDIVREMFLASGGCKAQRLDPTIMPAETVIEMGTINGAKAALWEHEIGSLEVGKKADIAIFDTRSADWRPVLNPIANLVYSSRGGADTVICNGKVVMEEGTVITIDEKKILAEGQQRAERVADKSGLWDKIRPLWPVT